MIIANRYAYLQLVIFILLMTALHFLKPEAYFPGFKITNDLPFLGLVYFCAIASFFTELAGLQGRVFWIPTWIGLCLLALLCTLSFDTVYLKAGNIVLSLGLCYGMMAFWEIRFAKRFAQAHTTLLTVKLPGLDGHAKFWQLISESYAEPSEFFLYAYPAYRRLFYKPVYREDFIGHYRELIRVIMPLVEMHDAARLKLFEYALDAPSRGQKYRHSLNALPGLKKIIKAYKKTY